MTASAPSGESSLSRFRGKWYQQFSRPQRDLIKRVITDQLDPYLDFQKDKADGSQRPISAPTPEWMDVLKVIQYRYLSSPHIASGSAFAYVAGRSAADCARVHLNSEWIIRVDVRDFFHSINEDRIYMCLKQHGLDSNSSRLLSRMTTRRPAEPVPNWLQPFRLPTRRLPGFSARKVKLGFLPQGSPTSGALSNLVTQTLDEILGAATQERGWRYTRYADDIFVSAPKLLTQENPHTVRRAVEEAVAITHQAIIVEGFTPNIQKTRVMRQGNRHIILGLLVDGNTLRPSRDKVAHVKFHMHALSNNGDWESHARLHGFSDKEAVINHIGGYLSYFADINPEMTEPLLRKWKNLVTNHYQANPRRVVLPPVRG